MIEVFLGILFILCALFFFIFMIVGCCCCCLGIPFLSLLCLTTKSSSTNFKGTTASSTSSSHFIYNDVSATPLTGAEGTDIPIAEAVIVPPLVAVHAERDIINRGYDIHQGMVQTSSSGNTKYSSGEWKDVWAGILFYIHLIIIFILAIKSYQQFQFNHSNSSSSTTPSSSSSSASSPQSEGFQWSLSTVLSLVFYASLTLLMVITMIYSTLKIILRNAESIIEWSFLGNIALLACSAIFSLISFQLLGALILFAFTALTYWFYLSAKDRIPFASAILKTACSAIDNHFTGILSVILFGCLFQLFWFILWTVAAYGSLTINQEKDNPQAHNGNHHHHNDDNDLNGLIGILLVFSLYWGIQVINYIVGVTCSGTIACWWFQPMRQAIVRGSLFRAVTTSFGSICFGSLLVAVLQTLRFLLSKLRRDRNRRGREESNIIIDCLIMLAEALLNFIEGLVVYFNRYAYAYVAAYGYGFVESGQKVMELFENR